MLIYIELFTDCFTTETTNSYFIAECHLFTAFSSVSFSCHRIWQSQVSRLVTRLMRVGVHWRWWCLPPTERNHTECSFSVCGDLKSSVIHSGSLYLPLRPVSYTLVWYWKILKVRLRFSDRLKCETKLTTQIKAKTEVIIRVWS